MEAYPARTLIVVTLDRHGSYEVERYVVMADGERLAEPSRALGGIFVFGNLSRAEHMASIEESIRRREPSPLPLDIEFVEVDTLPSRIPPGRLEALERRSKIGAFFLSVVIGAIWPSLWRRRIPTRATWRQQLRRGVTGWALANVLAERRRRAR